MNTDTAFAQLKARLAEIQDLQKASGLLEWDQQVMMPPQGAEVRAEVRATVERLAHEMFIAPDTGRLLDAAQPYEAALPADSDDASLIRVTRRDYDKARRVPPELQAEITRAGALGMEAWVEARKRSDFSLFLPFLEKNIELKRRYVECFPPAEDVYDVLLDDYEQGMKTAQVRTIFDALKRELVPLIAHVASRAGAADDACLHASFPVDQQREFCLSVVTRFGFDPQAWRMDPTVHPFETSFATRDVRITTRYYPDFINPGLFGCMHECGHGLYEYGVSPTLERTPLCGGVSMALHESQSRMWENLVGRSRPFWRFFYPRLQAAFPESLGRVELETFYRAVNVVQPSLIRVEADEATYALHIILRFELEQEIIGGKLALRDLPEAWNARMRAYLGVPVPDDAQGVLQDVHWSEGLLGYFPTYALGNLIAAQLWERALVAIPDLYAQFERGEFGALRAWLRENLHRHGRKFTPAETLMRAAGAPIQVGPFVRYLKAKLGEIHG